MTNNAHAGRAGRVVEYDGSLHQSNALRAIAMDAFQLDTYAESRLIRARLGQGHQQVWLADVEAASGPAGFLATFSTDSLAGRRIEFDLLAVRSDAQGQGLAGQLIQAALDYWRAPDTCAARALIRQENVASMRVFQRAGFAPAAWRGELLIGAAAEEDSVLADGSFTVGTAEEHDLPDLRRHWPAIFTKVQLSSYLPRDDFGLLVARNESGICGFAELLAVHTIAYSGVWVETLEALGDDAGLILDLIGAARRWAAGRGLGQAGAVIDLARESVRNRLSDAGYHSAGVYRHFHLPATEGDASWGI